MMLQETQNSKESISSKSDEEKVMNSRMDWMMYRMGFFRCAISASLCCHTLILEARNEKKNTDAIVAVVLEEKGCPKGGFYVGLGLLGTTERNDFTLNCMADTVGVAPHYMQLNYNNSNKKCSGGLFVGTKTYDPFFAAFEIQYTLSRANVEKRYNPGDELPGSMELGHCAHLSIERGNELAFLLKIGNTFGKNITPYILAGVKKRNVYLELTYPSPNAMIALGAAMLTDFTYGDRKFKSCGMAFVCGIGFTSPLNKSCSMNIEYQFSKSGTIEKQVLLDVNPNSLIQNLDTLGNPRDYHLRSRDTHSIFIGISKTL
jgi:hypothetical protein